MRLLVLGLSSKRILIRHSVSATLVLAVERWILSCPLTPLDCYSCAVTCQRAVSPTQVGLVVKSPSLKSSLTWAKSAKLPPSKIMVMSKNRCIGWCNYPELGWNRCIFFSNLRYRCTIRSKDSQICAGCSPFLQSTSFLHFS